MTIKQLVLDMQQKKKVYDNLKHHVTYTDEFVEILEQARKAWVDAEMLVYTYEFTETLEQDRKTCVNIQDELAKAFEQVRKACVDLQNTYRKFI